MMKAMRRSVEPRWWTLVAICGATFILLVDVTIVQVALPTIQRRLGAGFTDLQWVIDGYALTLAAFILTCGSLADRYGRKLVFVGGVACSPRRQSCADSRAVRRCSSPRVPCRASAAQRCSPQGWR